MILFVYRGYIMSFVSELGKWLNQLMVKFLNSYTNYKYELFGLIDNITNGWFKHLKQSIMRAIFVHISHDLPEQKVMDFFNLCVEIGIYEIHEVRSSLSCPVMYNTFLF